MSVTGAKKLKARAEIPQREWVEFEIDVSHEGKINHISWRALGCHDLLKAAGLAAAKIKTQNLGEISWPGFGHSDILVTEVFDKLKNTFVMPLTEDEICHCRKISKFKIDEAIVLGAHTPEKVKAWTTASSGCGTCRPEVEKMINFRLKRG